MGAAGTGSRVAGAREALGLGCVEAGAGGAEGAAIVTAGAGEGVAAGAWGRGWDRGGATGAIVGSGSGCGCGRVAGKEKPRISAGPTVFVSWTWSAAAGEARKRAAQPMAPRRRSRVEKEKLVIN